MTRYRAVTEWHVGAPVDRVWDVLLDVRGWPAWWRGFTSVEQLAAGDDAGVGMRIRQGWRAHLPYTPSLDLEIEEIGRHRLLAGRTGGDMAGTCRWTFVEEAGGTLVRFEMDVEPARWWMRLPVPLAGRVFAWNFGAVMRWGGEGLSRRLGALVQDASDRIEGRLALPARVG